MLADSEEIVSNHEGSLDVFTDTVVEETSVLLAMDTLSLRALLGSHGEAMTHLWRSFRILIATCSGLKIHFWPGCVIQPR